jgi:hypothetical protein
MLPGYWVKEEVPLIQVKTNFAPSSKRAVICFLNSHSHSHECQTNHPPCPRVNANLPSKQLT